MGDVADEPLEARIPLRVELRRIERNGWTGARGGAVRHASYSPASASSGAAATIDFELPLTRSLSVEAMAGVGRFNGKSGIPDVDIFTYVVDAKLYLVDGDWRPFVMGGGGVSSSNPGMAGGEWNVGAGLRYDASARFAFEAGYQFHETYQGGKGVPFSTLQVGVLLKF